MVYTDFLMIILLLFIYPYFTSPETVIENNALYSQSRIFKIPFANTEETTIGRKINGSDKMLEIIDSYWEAQGIMVKN